jgi:hypothetical protein
LLYRYETKEEIFLKNGSKTVYLFPIWSGERKNLPKEVILYAFSVLIWCERRKKKKIFLFWLAKCPLQESVVCKEEKISCFCIQMGLCSRVLV